MNLLGSTFAYHQLSMFQPSMLQPGAQGAAAPQHNLPADTSASTQSAPVPGGSYMPVAGMAYLSSGYFAVAPQMAAFGGANAGGMPVSAGLPTAQQVANADPAATSGTESGHVTANATNALATPSMSGGYGAPGAAAMGMAGMMAMPVGFVFAAPMMMMPVFFGFMSSAAPMQPPAALPPAADAPDAAAPVATPEAVEVPARVEEDSPPAAEESTRRSIMEMNTADFKRFRSSQLNAELSTSLSLQLKTKDGDSVTLDFSQLDLLERSHFKGKTLDGEHKHKHSREISSDRVVNMSVDGELDEAERAAIDAVLGDVIEVANQFFSNQLDSAMNKLQSMELDTATLAELSLKMNMSRTAEYSRSGGRPEGADGTESLQRLAQRDGEVSRVLDFFADQQRTLIDSASEVLDRPSAVKMVKSLLPPMLEKPFAQLAEKLDQAIVEAADVDTVEVTADEEDQA